MTQAGEGFNRNMWFKKNTVYVYWKWQKTADIFLYCQSGNKKKLKKKR